MKLVPALFGSANVLEIAAPAKNMVRRLGASPPEAKSSLAFESPAAEQNVPDYGYVAVHTGVNHKAFCNQKFKFKLTCMGVHNNYNELQPVRNDVYHAVCATSVRTVFCIHSQSGQISLSSLRGR